MSRKVRIMVPLPESRRCLRCRGKRMLFGWRVPGDPKQRWFECPDCEGQGHVTVIVEPIRAHRRP